MLVYSIGGLMSSVGTRSVRTESNGAFQFKDVAGGAYAVMASRASQRVTVAGADIEDVLLVARTGSSVSGEVATDEATPPPFGNSGVRVLLDVPDGNVLPTVASCRLARTGPSSSNNWEVRSCSG
jgi:hypothetical protein